MNIPVLTPSNRDVSQVTRLSTFRDACKALPINEYGLPKYLYRPDLIPEDLFFRSVEEQTDILGMASVDINYLEGFPAFDSQASMWSQMDFEPDDAYAAFKQYLAQGEMLGVRRLEMLAQDNTYAQHIAPNLRGLTKLTELHTYYSWAPRCKAADLFERAANAKMRERRVMSTQERHFLEAERMLELLRTKYFDRKDEETGEYIWIEELTPKVALEFLDKLTKLQRVSLGLAAHGLADGTDGGLQKNASVEVTLRQIARMGADPEANRSHSSGAGLDLLLSDPETAMLAQQLIVKVGGGAGTSQQHAAANGLPAGRPIGNALDAMNNMGMSNAPSDSGFVSPAQKAQELQRMSAEAEVDRLLYGNVDSDGDGDGSANAADDIDDADVDYE